MGAAAANGCRPTVCIEACKAPFDAEGTGDEPGGIRGHLAKLHKAGTQALGKGKTFFGTNNEASALEASTATASAAALQVARRERTPDEELQQGAMRGDMRKVQRALEMCANITVINPRGVNPLMLAAASLGKDNVKVVEELLAKQADCDSRDHNGWTALHHACRNGKLEVARPLMAAKSDPSQLTADHKTCVMLAVLEGKPEMVKELLKVESVRSQVADRDALSCTCLHYAAKNGSSDIAKLLVDAAAKVNAKDIDGRMPLSWAAEYGKLDTIRLLCKRAADIDTKDKTGRTPMFYALYNSYEGAGLWLLKKGAEPFVRDAYGDTPSSVAEDNGLAEFKRAMKLRRTADDQEED